MFYRVDRRDHLVEVGPDWDDFALANDGSAAAARQVLGRPLAAFMKGDPTRLFVFSALEAVRVTRRNLSLPYRCDCPHERRQFEMQLQAEADGCVRVEHRLIAATARPARQPRPQRAGWQCSQCLATRPLGREDWLDAGQSPVELIGYDVCPACAARLFDRLPPRPDADGRG